MDLGAFTFANDFAEVASHPPQPTKSSWRLTPEKSYSDWTIELEILRPTEEAATSLADDDDNNRAALEDNDDDYYYNDDVYDDDDVVLQTVFHVHKIFLGSGDRRSLYFERVFNDCRKNAEDTTSGTAAALNNNNKIKLEKSAVRAFPIMLDYLYSSLADGPLNVERSDSAVALRWLSTYFGIKPMFEATNEFISDNLSISNAHTYLKEAAIFNDNKIVEAASTICSEKLDHMMVDSMVQLSPEHFSLVVDKAKFGFQPSELLSQRVKAYCDAHRDTITAEMLTRWTDYSVMPVIAPDAALSLLRHADAHNLDHTMDDVVVSDNNDDVDNNDGIIMCLHGRCAKAASLSWETTLIDSVQNKEDAIKSGYCDISDKTKVAVLQKALVDASTRVQPRKQQGTKKKRNPSFEQFEGTPFFGEVKAAPPSSMRGKPAPFGATCEAPPHRPPVAPSSQSTREAPREAPPTREVIFAGALHRFGSGKQRDPFRRDAVFGSLPQGEAPIDGPFVPQFGEPFGSLPDSSTFSVSHGSI